MRQDRGPGGERVRRWVIVVALGVTPSVVSAATNIAVLDFRAVNASSSEAAVVSSFVRSAAVRRSEWAVVDKTNMDKVLGEQAFQQTGCTSQECAVKLGRILNVTKMVVGEYASIEETRYITAHIVDVESGQIERSATLRGFSSATLDETAAELVARLAANDPAPASLEDTALPGRPVAAARPDGWRIWTGYAYAPVTAVVRIKSQWGLTPSMGDGKMSFHRHMYGVGLSRAGEAGRGMLWSLAVTVFGTGASAGGGWTGGGSLGYSQVSESYEIQRSGPDYEAQLQCAIHPRLLRLARAFFGVSGVLRVSNLATRYVGYRSDDAASPFGYSYEQVSFESEPLRVWTGGVGVEAGLELLLSRALILRVTGAASLTTRGTVGTDRGTVELSGRYAPIGRASVGWTF